MAFFNPLTLKLNKICSARWQIKFNKLFCLDVRLDCSPFSEILFSSLASALRLRARPAAAPISASDKRNHIFMGFVHVLDANAES